MATVDGVSRGAAEWMWRLGQTQAWGGWQEQAPGLLMLEQLLWSPGLSVLTPASVDKNTEQCHVVEDLTYLSISHL